MALQHLRSNTANKRPDPTAMADGQLAINTPAVSPGLFFKDAAGVLVKVGPVHVGTTAPNASPASGGTAGNSVGEQWLDTTGGTYVFKVWDGSAWRSESGTFVDVNGDVMTGALGIIAGSAAAPGLYFSGDTNTGIYSPGADQLAISTGGSGRLFVDASGNVGIGATPGSKLDVAGITRITNFATNFSELSLQARYSNSFSSIGLGQGGDGTGYLINQHNASIALGTNNTERLRITSAGLVGIGTSSPAQTLHVVGRSQFQPATGTRVITLVNTSGGDGSIEVSGGATSMNYGFSTYSTTNALYIQNDGKVGIGDTGPDSTLTIKAAAATTPLKVSGPTSEFLRCDQQGRLLVGTSSISVPTSIGVQGNSGSSTGEAVVRLNRGTANPTTGQTLGAIVFGQSSANDGAYILGEADAAWGTNDYPTRLVFSTTADGASSPTERMRIDSRGFIYPDVASSAQAADYQTIDGSGFRIISSTSITAARFEARAASIDTRYAAVFSNPNGIVGSISTGNSATSYATSSDYRLKENVTPVTDGITRLQQLKPSRFNFIADPAKTVDGFLAHEAAEVVPECVTGEKDAVDADGNPVYQGIDQSKLVPLLTAALQEAIGEIESLKARLTAAGI